MSNSKLADESTHGVIGRDGFILCKALSYAIEAIEHLPKQWQEWSDKGDMILLLRAAGEHGFCATINPCRNSQDGAGGSGASDAGTSNKATPIRINRRKFRDENELNQFDRARAAERQTEPT